MNQQINLAAGIAGGLHSSSQPLTTDVAEAAAPGLLTNAVDQAITRIRPMSTPVDQISRLGHVRRVDSLNVDYYSVDSRGDRVSLTALQEIPDGADAFGNLLYSAELSGESSPRLEVSESFCYSAGALGMMTAYVVAVQDKTVQFLCPDESLSSRSSLSVVRMGRAATQLDVQSPQFNALPKKMTNYCQIFKMQVEQSTVMRLSHKEIGWDFTDQQEAALYDMRLGMEKQFLFGKKMKVFDHVKGENVTLTQGIWSQAAKEIPLDLSTLDGAQIVDMMRMAFTENSGSRRKVLVAGSELIAALNKLDVQRVASPTDRMTAWGIDFSEICSKFGRLFVVFDEVFDTMGMQTSGLIIDPDYLQKHVFIPLSAETLDLRGSGQRNTEAVVLTEASCLTLRYPGAHARVVGM